MTPRTPSSHLLQPAEFSSRNVQESGKGGSLQVSPAKKLVRKNKRRRVGSQMEKIDEHADSRD